MKRLRLNPCRMQEAYYKSRRFILINAPVAAPAKNTAYYQKQQYVYCHENLDWGAPAEMLPVETEYDESDRIYCCRHLSKTVAADTAYRANLYPAGFFISPAVSWTHCDR